MRYSRKHLLINILDSAIVAIINPFNMMLLGQHLIIVTVHTKEPEKRSGKTSALHQKKRLGQWTFLP